MIMNTYFYSASTTSTFGSKHRKQDISVSDLLEIQQSALRVHTQKGNRSMLAQLIAFAGREVTIRKINTDFCIGFADHLLMSVKVNSARTYLQKLHALLHNAVRLGYISCNPMPPIADLLPKYKAPEREYLDRNEIRKLERTQCRHETTKLAFLFSCHTGLRISDIETLTWGDIYRQKGKYLISKIQVKTGVEVRIPLDAAAEDILQQLQTQNPPQRNERIFSLKSRTVVSQDLNEWALAAGIEKHVTFHVARHTFATLMITQKTDIYTVSQLCGHTSIQTTLVYVRLVDSARFEAMEGLDELFGYPRSRKPVKLTLPYRAAGKKT